jgi:plasmid stability protein
MRYILRVKAAEQEKNKMSTLTIRLPDDQHARLRTMAAQRGISLNKLFEEFTTRAVTEFDCESRFRVLAARGDPALGLRILDEMDVAFETRS